MMTMKETIADHKTRWMSLFREARDREHICFESGRDAAAKVYDRMMMLAKAIAEEYSGHTDDRMARMVNEYCHLADAIRAR